MRRFTVTLLLLLMLVLTGCRTGANAETGNNSVSEKVVYPSDTSKEACLLCGDGIENLIPTYWEQNNVALINLNTFEINPVEINRYDRIDGHLIEELQEAAFFLGIRSETGGFSSSMMLDPDRGYATGSIDFYDDKTLDVDKAASFLCADCLNEILPQRIEQCFGVGVIHLDTKEIRVFEETIAGFGLEDFYVDCSLRKPAGNTQQMSLLIFYCPVQYENKS